jgi:predicted RNA-binding Zn-ribbon protein involved in translation (DUF1610 family)
MPWLMRGDTHVVYNRDVFLWYRIKMIIRLFIIGITNVGETVKTYFNRVRFPKKKRKMCVVCYENKRPVKINCKHDVCASCLGRIVFLNSNYAFKCPMCSKNILGESQEQSQ